MGSRKKSLAQELEELFNPAPTKGKLRDRPYIISWGIALRELFFFMHRV